jgi:penicillin-binding protein 2
MNRVTQSQMGTAYGSRLIFDSAVQMGGKTGTAQVQRITLAQRAAGVKNEDLDWTSRHHALFVGYAPSDHPRFAVSVVVEHGIGGARTAAPLARDLMTLALKRHYVPSDISVPTPQKEEKEG